MKADKTSLELAIIEAYAHLEDSKPSPTDGGTTFSRFSNGERNWTVPVTLVARASKRALPLWRRPASRTTTSDSRPSRRTHHTE